MTPEGRVKQKVTALLKKYRAYYHMPVQTGRGAPALDYHVCYKGHYIGIETKAPGKKLTERQLLICQMIMMGGGYIAIVDSDEALRRLEALFLLLDRTHERGSIVLT